MVKTTYRTDGLPQSDTGHIARAPAEQRQGALLMIGCLAASCNNSAPPTRKPYKYLAAGAGLAYLQYQI